MITDLSPRHQFQQLTEIRKVFQGIVGEPAFRTALTYATAEMSRSGAGADQLAGARAFIEILYTLADSNVDLRLPTKALTQLDSGPPERPE